MPFLVFEENKGGKYVTAAEVNVTQVITQTNWPEPDPSVYISSPAAN